MGTDLAFQSYSTVVLHSFTHVIFNSATTRAAKSPCKLIGFFFAVEKLLQQRQMLQSLAADTKASKQICSELIAWQVRS